MFCAAPVNYTHLIIPLFRGIMKTSILRFFILMGAIAICGILFPSNAIAQAIAPPYKIADIALEQDEVDIEQTLSLDIDADSISDLSIYSDSWYFFFGGPYPGLQQIKLSGIRLESFTDATIIENTIKDLDTLSYGDTLKYNSNWFNGNARLCSSIYIPYPLMTWKDKGSYYVGLRKRKQNDTLYGWLKLRVEDYHIVYLEEFAFQSSNPMDTIISSYNGYSYNVLSLMMYF